MAKNNIISEKKFLKLMKKNQNSPGEFLKTNKNWLETNDLTTAAMTSPTLNKYFEGEISADIAFRVISNVIFQRYLTKDIEKEENEKRFFRKAATPKNYIATILNSLGEIETHLVNGEVKELKQGFLLAEKAKQWAANRLMNCYTDCYAEIEDTTHTFHGKKMKETLTRNMAYRRLFPKTSGSVCKTLKVNNSKLGFVGKAKQSYAAFSKG